MLPYCALLARQANGVDTGWMLPAEHQDLCGGFRQSSFDSAIFFAVSEVPTYQNMQAVGNGAHDQNTLLRGQDVFAD